jgi:asparagine synthetase B (glutamine-hydrolysing)
MQMLYLELKQRLPELLLMRADKMSMAASVEAREPYLDHKLVEFMMHVPANLRIKNGKTKYLLKKVCEDVLPENIIYRKKVGFGAPTFRWFEQGAFFPPYFKTLQQNQKKGLLSEIIPARIDKQMYSKNYLSAAVQRWVLQQALTLGQ